jgi:hypothetical protein
MPKVFLKVSTENNPKLVEGEDFVAELASSHISDFSSAVQALAGSGTQVSAGTLHRSSEDGSGAEEVPLGFRPSIVLLSAMDDIDPTSSSDGWDNGTAAACSSAFSSSFLLTLLGALGAASLSTKSHEFSVWIQDASQDGHRARISAVSEEGFALDWTRLGQGRNVTVKYLAVR